LWYRKSIVLLTATIVNGIIKVNAIDKKKFIFCNRNTVTKVL